MKKTLKIAVALSILIITTLSLNFLMLQLPVNTKINSDGRNIGIEFSVHAKYFVMPNQLVIDLKKFSKSSSNADILRGLLQIAWALKDKDFDIIHLQHNGVPKFTLNGSFFRKLGSDYEYQNPTITIMSFTKNVLTIEGTSAYPRSNFDSSKLDNDNFSELKDFTNKWFFDDIH